MRTIPLTIEHARDVAALHIQGINTGFISSLGIDFVTALYEAIAKSTSAFGYAVEDNDHVLGFVAFTTNLNRLYKSIIAKKGWRFALLLAGKMFSLQRIKRIFQTLFYPSRTKKMDLPEAELLSIAIDPEKYHKGLATELVQKSLEHCREIGLDRVKVLVSAGNEPANRLYQKCGFRLVRQIDSHGIKSNIYEAQTAEALKKTRLLHADTGTTNQCHDWDKRFDDCYSKKTVLRDEAVCLDKMVIRIVPNKKGNR
ncbi:MAG: GNAT family N-acetyltransferase [Planctomycetota bacterium]